MSMPMVCSSMRVRRAVVRVTVRHYDYDCSAMEVAKVLLLSDPEKGSLQWRGTIRWWGPSVIYSTPLARQRKPQKVTRYFTT
jgi:hypothetical protein